MTITLGNPTMPPVQTQFIEFGQQAPRLHTVDHAHQGPPEVCTLWLTTPILGHRKYARCGSPHSPRATGSMHAVAHHTHMDHRKYARCGSPHSPRATGSMHAVVHHTHPGPPEVCTLWFTTPTPDHRKYARYGSPYSPWAAGCIHDVAHHTHHGPQEVCTLWLTILTMCHR